VAYIVSPVFSHSLSQPLVCEIFFRTISQTCNSARKKLTASTKFLWNISAYCCSVYNNIPTWRNIYGFSSIRFNHSCPILWQTFLLKICRHENLVFYLSVLISTFHYFAPNVALPHDSDFNNNITCVTLLFVRIFTSLI